MQTTKPTHIPDYAESGTNKDPDGPAIGNADLPDGSTLTAKFFNRMTRKFSKWIQYLTHANENHVHGGTGDLAALKIDLNEGIKIEDGSLAYSEDATDLQLRFAAVKRASVRAQRFIASTFSFSDNDISIISSTDLDYDPVSKKIEITDSAENPADKITRVTNYISLDRRLEESQAPDSSQYKGIYSGENLISGYLIIQITPHGTSWAINVMRFGGWRNHLVPLPTLDSSGILSIDLTNMTNGNKGLVASVTNLEAVSDPLIVQAYIVGGTAKIDVRKLTSASIFNPFANGNAIAGSAEISIIIV